jgi:hypothetical protein
LSLLPALPAALAAVGLLLLPALAWLLLLPRREREALEPDEALFLATGSAVALAAWVGLVLAELGRFSLTGAGALLGGASALVIGLRRRELGTALRRPSSRRLVLGSLAVFALAFALQARPSEYLVGGRDPGAYVGAMGLIARSGGIAFEDPAVLSIPREDRELFYRHPDAPDRSWGRFMGFNLESTTSGRVVPQFFHLFPAFGAYLFQAMGVKGALATPVVFGILGTLAVLFALRRLLGPEAALLGALLLATNVVQVWFARYPMSEGMSQFLVFLGLLAFAHWEERGHAAFGVLAGAALGLTLLVRIDSVLIAAPLGAWALVRLAQGLSWRRLAALALPFGLLALHAAGHALLFARSYARDIVDRPYWRQPLPVWITAAVLAVAVLALAPRLGRELARIGPPAEKLRLGLSLLLVALALYAWFLRPELSAWAGADGNREATALADPAWLRSLGFHRLAAHDAQALVRLGWFVTPLGIVLGVGGLLWTLRCWRSRQLFLLLLALAFGLFYLYKIRVFNDYYFAMRRYVPVVLPALLGYAGLLLWQGLRRGGWRRGLAAAAGLVLAALFARDTARVWRHVDWKGAVAFTGDVARRFGPRDVVVFEQAQHIHLLSLPLWSVWGVNVLELARFDPDPRQLAHLIRSWRGRYRNIYFVYTYRSDLCSLFLQRVEPFRFFSYEWERGYAEPPDEPVPQILSFSLARVVDPEQLSVPPVDELNVGGTDDAFVSAGFYEKEGGGDHTYRWTGRCASIYLPGARAGGRVELTASVGVRPPSRPAEVTVSLSGVELGRFTVGAERDAHEVPLPDPLPPGPPLLRLDVPAWRPINELPGSQDTRDLGIMVERVRLRAPER